MRLLEGRALIQHMFAKCIRFWQLLNRQFDMHLSLTENHNYVTLLRNSARCNKIVTLQDGELHKQPAGLINEAVATTLRVDDQAAMIELLNEVSEHENYVLILGYMPHTESLESYKICSRKELARLLGCDVEETPPGLHEINGAFYATRTKANFVASSWLMFDYDAVDGMPAELVTEDPVTWWRWMCAMCPPLQNVGCILKHSTTGRIRLNGKQAFKKVGWHGFVQVQDATDIPRFASELLPHALSTPYGFMRPLYSRDSGAVIGKRPWTIFDPSVLSPERLVFEGKPFVSGEGLTVAPCDLHVIKGDSLDTQALRFDQAKNNLLKQKFDLSVMADGRDSVGLTHLVSETLTLATAVETEIGSMTVRDFWHSDHQRLRAQTPFRPESTSFAAYLGRHSDGTPFLYDSGTTTKFVPKRADVNTEQMAAAKKWLETSSRENVIHGWGRVALSIGSSILQQEFKRLVSGRFGIPIRDLNNALKEAERAAGLEQIEQHRKSFIEAQRRLGKIVINWEPDQLVAVVAAIKAQLVKSEGQGHVFCSGGLLVEAAPQTPASIRQFIKLRTEGLAYQQHFVTVPFTKATLHLRVLRCVTFLSRNGELMGCPHEALQAILDDPTFAKPLIGFIEAPVISPDGDRVTNPGYDKRTGFYATFPAALSNGLPAHATKQDAAQALAYLRTKVFSDFPFVTDVDECVAISSMLTTFVRRFLNRAPATCVTATRQNTGKSALVDVIHFAFAGRPAPAASWTDDQDEMRKVITGLLKDNFSFVSFDNLRFAAHFYSDELCKLITQEVYEARILGVNKQLRAPTNITVFLTGNKISPVKDLSSRVLTLTLDADVENPSARKFLRTNIDQWCEANRSEMIKAVFTILLAWQQHGKGVFKLENQSRFPEWDHAVRAPLMWLGLPDLCDVFAVNEVSDPLHEARVNFLDAAHHHYGSNPFFVRDLIKDGYTDFGQPIGALGDALAELFEDQKPSASRVGKNLALFRDVVMDGFKLVQVPYAKSNRSARPWRILKNKEQGVVRGEVGCEKAKTENKATTPIFLEGVEGYTGFSPVPFVERSSISKSSSDCGNRLRVPPLTPSPPSEKKSQDFYQMPALPSLPNDFFGAVKALKQHGLDLLAEDVRFLEGKLKGNPEWRDRLSEYAQIWLSTLEQGDTGHSQTKGRTAANLNLGERL